MEHDTVTAGRVNEKCDTRPMQQAPAPPQRSSVGLSLFLGGAFVVVVGIGVLIYFMTRPRGEKVGESSLVDRDAAIGVEAQAGDTLYFRTNVEISVPVLSLKDDERTDREASDELRKSQLTVRATSPAGIEKSSTCRVYNGRATTTSTSTGSFARSGMLNDCVIVIDAPGRWTVRASVDWSAGVTLRRASLETRRERAARSP